MRIRKLRLRACIIGRKKERGNLDSFVVIYRFSGYNKHIFVTMNYEEEKGTRIHDYSRHHQTHGKNGIPDGPAKCPRSTFILQKSSGKNSICVTCGYTKHGKSQ